MGEPVILTSETPEATQAFYARRLGLDAPEPAVAAEQAEPAVESVPEKKPELAKDATEGENDDVEQHVPNPEARQKVHYRFSELTERAKTAEAKAAEAAAKVETEAKARILAEQEAASLRAKYEPPKADLGPKPTRAQFVNETEYEAAIEDWTTDKVTRERDAQERGAKVARAWAERQTAVKAAIPDYDAAIEAASELAVTNKVRDAILDSEQGPKILYHLAKNPDVVAKLHTLESDAQLRLIGKLEGRFETEAAKPKDEPAAKVDRAAVVAAEISRAPAPITPLKAAKTAPESPVDSKGEFHGTFEQYKAARKAGQI